MSLKYKNNFNPNFINDYFKKLNNNFDVTNEKLIEKLDLIYDDYLLDEENNFDKYFNGLLYCLNYIDAIYHYKYDKYIYHDFDEFNEFKVKVKTAIIKIFKKHKLNKENINLMIVSFLKVNEFYYEVFLK